MSDLSRYELITVLSGQLSAEQINAWQGALLALVGKWGGIITRCQNLGVRNLSYRIRRKDTGYERTGIAIVTELELPSNAAKLLERAFQFDPMVLRSMTTHAKPPTKAPRLNSPVPIMTAPASSTRAAEVAEASVRAQEGTSTESLSTAELDKRLDEILEVKEL